VYSMELVFKEADRCLATWGICASSHILVPVSWLSSIPPYTVIAYFLMLFGTTTAHMHTYPLIWWGSIYTVPWFASPTPNEADATTQPEPASGFPSRSKTQSVLSNRNSFIAVRFLRHRFSAKVDDVESISEPILFPRQSNGLHPVPARGSLPGWARKATIRRGLDTPFTWKKDPAETIKLAAPQPRIAQPRRGVDPPFATKVDGPTVPPTIYIEGNLPVPRFNTRPLSPLQRELTVSTAFSQKVEDQDSPIPLPNVSEWIRADSKYVHGGPRQQ